MSTWKRSKEANLYRHECGGYYARTKVAGVDKWATLETDVFSVAQARLPKKLSELKQGRDAANALTRGVATFGDAAEAYKASVELNTQLKPASIHYRLQTIAGLLKSWPGLASCKLPDITESQCQLWAKRYAGMVHGTRFNNTVDTLRGILAIGIERGLIHKNPAADVGKRKVAPKKLELPSREQFEQLVKEIATNGAWCSRDCANLVQFLAYSGCRITEAANVKWEDVDGAKGTIRIHGDAETGTKNSESRTIPIIPAMRDLLDRLTLQDRETRDQDRVGLGFIMTVMECRGALDEACQKVGIKRIHHHDLRHLFATRCIESGVDIPTVSRWLGHKDGGALAMKTYGHLRDEHSQDMAAKVSF